MTDIVLIGCGSIAKKHHANILRLGSDVVAAADPEMRYIPPNIKHKYADPDECLKEHADGSTVVIASPSKFHAAQAFKAMEYGCKALLVEKPLGINMADVDGLAEYAETNNVRAAVAYNYRFHRVVHDVLHPAQHDQDGMQRFLHISSTDDIRTWPNYRPGCYMLDPMGGGVLLTCATHSIDMAVHLFGEAENVSASIIYDKENSGLDTDAVVRIVHKSQGVSWMGTRWNRPPHSVIGYVSGKSADSFDLLSPSCERDRSHMHLWMMEMFLIYADGGDRGRLCTFEEAVHTVRIIDAAKQSWNERTDVKL